MIPMFTEAEQEEIEALTESLIKDKEKELQLLKAIAGDAKYAAPKKIRNEIISYAELAETTFLKGKQLTLLLETGKKESAYDFSKMGTTEEFPCSLEYDGEVWEFYLPPTPSVKNGTTARNVGRYIGYLVKNLLRQHEEVYGRIERLTSPVVVFEFGLSELTPLYRAFDADNRDNKRILDAMTGTFFEDDNVLSVMTVHYGVISPCSCTRVYVMEEVVYREWKSKNSQR